MNRQMNEPMRVELGIWPIFAFLVNPAFWTGVGYVTSGVGALTLTNSVISMFNQPKTESVSIPGVVGARGLSSGVATALQRQQTELEALHQEALQKQEELKKLEAQTAIKQKTQYALSKYGPFLVAGGAVLVVLLAIKKRKKK